MIRVQLLLIYFSITFFLLLTIGLIIFSDNNFRDATIILLCWPLWLIPLFFFAITACIIAFIKNKKIDDVCDEMENALMDSKFGQWLDRRFK